MKLCPNCHRGLLGEPKNCSVCAADLRELAPVDGDGLSGMQLGEGRYEIVDLLGEGGMAWVYRGIHKALDREVAVKLLKPGPEGVGAEQRGRFDREARLASRLNHPHILSTVDFGETRAGIKYLVTEYIKGKSLDHVLWKEPQLPLSRTSDIFHQVLAAIDEAHSNGVIHRDIKPENIIVNTLRSGEDFVKVVDFGIAVLSDGKDGRVTKTGAFIGTPGYMSPEQILGKEASEQSDIYALGAVLYEMLTGRPLYDDPSPFALITVQLEGKYKPISKACPNQPELTAFEGVVERSVAPEPSNRYRTITDFREDFLRAISKVSHVNLDCSACSRPVDPTTGLCRLHGRSKGPSKSPRMTTPFTHSNANKGAQTQPLRGSAGGQVDAALFAQEDVLGRERELARIADFFSSEDVILVITGAAGLGKTTLLSSVEIAGKKRIDVPVFRMAPDPLSAYSPWVPVRQIVGQALECGTDPEAPFDAQTRPAEFENFKDHIDGMNALFGFPSNRTKNDVDRRHRIHLAALSALLCKTQNGTGPIILADDVDSYDRASLDFIRSLGGLARETPLKVIATATRDPGGFTRGTRTLHLNELSEAANDALVQRLFKRTKETARRKLDAIAGSRNPAHAMMAWRLAKEGGNPEGTMDALAEARLSALPEESLEMLQTIAMLGWSVSTSTLDTLTGNEQWLLALQVLVQRGIVKSTPSQQIEIIDSILARHALDNLTDSGRQHVALRLFETLEPKGDSVFQLARLADRAKVFDRAVRYLEQAGDEACAKEDLTGAAMIHYRRASHLARWELLMSEEGETYLRIAVKMGKALKKSGHRKSAEVVLKEVVSSGHRFPRFVDEAKRFLDETDRWIT